MCKSTNNSSNTSINPTDKANKSITKASNFALRHGHSQLEPLHLCCIQGRRTGVHQSGVSLFDTGCNIKLEPAYTCRVIDVLYFEMNDVSY